LNCEFFVAFTGLEVAEMLSNVPRTGATPPAGKDAHDEEPRDDDTELVYYWQLPRAFTESRHTEKIAAFQTDAQPWRMKERVCAAVATANRKVSFDNSEISRANAKLLEQLAEVNDNR